MLTLPGDPADFMEAKTVVRGAAANLFILS
jgi:hypothetical protein